MSVNSLNEYCMPEHAKDHLRRFGFVLPLDDMRPQLQSWDDWMSARGVFYDYRDKDDIDGKHVRVHHVHVEKLNLTLPPL